MVLSRLSSYLVRLLLGTCIILLALNNLEPATTRSKSNFITKTFEYVKTHFQLSQVQLVLSQIYYIINAESVLFGLAGLCLIFRLKISRIFFFIGMVLNFGLINNYYLYRNENVLKSMSYMITLFGSTFL
jgi:hypothetical protein